MTQIATRIESWHRSYAQAMPYASVALMALAVLTFHALFQFNVGLEALYILPLWLSIRLLGAQASLFTVIGISFILTISRPQVTGISLEALLTGFGVRLIGFSLVGLLIAWFESSYNHAKGLAYKDPLTGLLNRHALSELKERLFGGREKEAVVVVLDCDGFKQVNDQYGHNAGDHILKMLARILEHETRSSDSLVRLGGDEFALILKSANGAEARTVLERVQQVFERYVADAGYECSISFGIAEPSSDEGLEDALAKADAAMYHHKHSKKQTSF